MTAQDTTVVDPKGYWEIQENQQQYTSPYLTEQSDLYPHSIQEYLQLPA